MTDNNEFDNLRTLHAALVAREWSVGSSASGSPEVVAGSWYLVASNVSGPEAAFIVAAHSELPALLARLDEVTAERDALATVIEKVRRLRDEWFYELEDESHLVRLDRAIEAVDASLSADPSSALAAHDAKVRAEALREAADLIENHWAPDSADGEEIVSGSVDLLRARADKEENR